VGAVSELAAAWDGGPHRILESLVCISARRDFAGLFGWLAFNWLFVVFIEEGIYRAYMINRWIDLLGDHPVGWALG
jgi:hypothetical protein